MRLSTDKLISWKYYKSKIHLIHQTTEHHSLASMHAQLLSHVWLFVTPQSVAYEAPLSMGFSRQEYWSGLPFPPLQDLPNPGIEPTSPASPALAGGFFTTEPPGKPLA